ncbi:LuxR C-terminal-related transcriptional regulator [Streptomyces graminilatus]|uniref:LuxR C-terminal-related transcriptional regulator n=1 Tax=Streptomyces graminilatus TaxID=1464070 RepID=UPI0018E3F5B7|nr:response regulator transcription factor [Streptomyces graminilatus]
MLLVHGRDSVYSRVDDLMERASGIELVAAVESGIEGVRLACELRPDVVLVHHDATGIDGIEVSRQITQAPWAAGVRVVMLADAITETWVFGALNSGVSGFLEIGDQAAGLVDAIKSVARGDAHLSPAATRCVLDRIFPLTHIVVGEEMDERFTDLTPREREVVSFAALGLDNREISDRLIVSHLTVKTHINRAMLKLDIRSRAQLVAEAHRNGLVRARGEEAR